jgi:anti-anti-sigma factor
MEIDVQVAGKALVACVKGRVDTLSAPAFEKGLAEALNREEKCLVFDLAGLEYISSAGLRVFLTTAKMLKAKGGEIRLAATQGSVRKVFQISGFFTLFKHFDTREDALATL